MVVKRCQKGVILCFYLSFLICASMIAVQAQQANNSITGFVFGLEQNPIPDVPVELSDENYSLIARVRTDGIGRYIFQRLRRGRYYVRVSPIATDYEGQTKEIEISGISGGAGVNSGSDTIQQNFYLQLKGQTSKRSLSSNGVLFAQEIPKDAQKLYEKALTDLKDKKVEVGLVELRRALEIFPTYYLALNTLGKELINQQKYEEARSVLIKSVEINPRGFSSQYSLGYSLYQLKKYPEAHETIKKAINLSPDSVNSFFLLGVCLKQLGRYDEAVENLKKANKLSNSPQAEIHWQLSLIYTNNLKRYADAANELDIFLQIKPDYKEAEKVRELIKQLRRKANS